MALYYLISAACGITVACAETISRYKAEPMKAVLSWWGLAYICLNALLSAVAFAILDAAELVSCAAAAFDNLKYAFAAGFGAAVIMRAKISNLRLTSGEQVSVGPDFVIDTLLGVLDRQIDRQRARRRAKIVRESLLDVDYEKAKMPIITLLTHSMQGITDSEMRDIGRRLAELDGTELLSNQDRAYALGFLVLDFAGEEFFREVFSEDARKMYLTNGS